MPDVTTQSAQSCPSIPAGSRVIVIAMSSLVPSIDLSVWTKPTATAAELEKIASDWDSAFHSSGLVYLTNHGLGELYHMAADEWSHFCAMQAEEKEKFSTSVYGASGYNSVGREAVALSEADVEEGSDVVLADPVESLENGYSDGFCLSS